VKREEVEKLPSLDVWVAFCLGVLVSLREEEGVESTVRMIPLRASDVDQYLEVARVRNDALSR
jgi:hypothetical protein